MGNCSSEWLFWPTEWRARGQKAIGRCYLVCHNRAAMDQWHTYKKELRRYLRVLPLAPLVALIPFLFNLEYWQDHGGLWRGMSSSLIYGLIIGLTIGLFFGLFYAALTRIKIRTGKFYQPPVVIQILLGSFSAVTGIWLVTFTQSLWDHKAQEMPPFLPALIFSVLIAAAFALYFAYQRAKEESLALRAESAEARYHALENQMRPHFLFNALNSLAELIESGREDAAETTYKLSDLYRRILANSGMKTASLASELEIVRAYLELEQLRFGDRLKFEICAPENCGEIFLPSLLLQTLVENAVKHGVSPSVEGGHVQIQIVSDGDGYRLSVTNSGAPLSAQQKDGTGLTNTKARLALLYGNAHGFAVRMEEQGRTYAGFHFSGRHIE